MARRFSPIASVAFLVALMALVTPASVWANSGPPWVPGDVVGEPSGGLANIHIEREELAFDLRPLATGDDVNVTATYHVRNDGAAAQVDLVFVAAALADGASGVSLDGLAVPVRTDQDASDYSPPDGTWQPSGTTPGIDGPPINYVTLDPGALLFTLSIPAGRHTISVDYAASPSRYSGHSPARYWQLGYVLAPARQWASFGTLDVTIQLPPEWSFAASPALERAGDLAHGTFDGIPADSIGMTTQMPVSAPQENYAPAIVTGAGVVLGLLIAAYGGAWLARRGRRARVLLPVSIVWSGLTAAAALAVRAGTNQDASIPAVQQSSNYGYGSLNAVIEAMVMVLALIVVVCVLIVAMQTIAAVSARLRGRTASPVR